MSRQSSLSIAVVATVATLGALLWWSMRERNGHTDAAIPPVPRELPKRVTADRGSLENAGPAAANSIDSAPLASPNAPARELHDERSFAERQADDFFAGRIERAPYEWEFGRIHSPRSTTVEPTWVVRTGVSFTVRHALLSLTHPQGARLGPLESGSLRTFACPDVPMESTRAGIELANLDLRMTARAERHDLLFFTSEPAVHFGIAPHPLHRPDTGGSWGHELTTERSTALSGLRELIVRSAQTPSGTLEGRPAVEALAALIDPGLVWIAANRNEHDRRESQLHLLLPGGGGGHVLRYAEILELEFSWIPEVADGPDDLATQRVHVKARVHARFRAGASSSPTENPPDLWSGVETAPFLETYEFRSCMEASVAAKAGRLVRAECAGVFELDVHFRDPSSARQGSSDADSALSCCGEFASRLDVESGPPEKHAQYPDCEPCDQIRSRLERR